MADNRLDRELDSRAVKTRKRAWQRPEVLPTPNEQDGWAFRWIRVAVQGNSDPTNVSSKLREGWEPVKKADHPEIFMQYSEDERYGDNIVMGGLMLCRAPQELVQERAEYFRNQTKSQMRSVNNNLMKEEDSRMPLFREAKSEVSFGEG